MKLPEIQNADRYTGLYIVDFGDHCGVGFRAEEVAELLESEKFQNIHVYKIHNAHPDGRLELKGINNDIFNLEAGMFFYSTDEDTASSDYYKLVDCTNTTALPCRAKLNLARITPDSYVTALIYPAEYDDEISRWLLDQRYTAAGHAEGGIRAVERYYQYGPEVLKSTQVFNRETVVFSGENLMAAARQAVVR